MNYFSTLKDKSFDFEWVSKVDLSPIEINEMQAYFDSRKLENPKIFNGKGISCKEWKVSENSIQVKICETDFQRNLWGRNVRKGSARGLAIIGAVCIFVDLGKRFIQLEKRSDSVIYNNHYGPFGGMVEYSRELSSMNSAMFLDYISKECIREVNEEVVTNEGKCELSDIFDYGIASIFDIGKIDFGFFIKKSIKEIGSDESDSYATINFDDLEKFISENASQMIPSCLPLLRYFLDNYIIINGRF